MDAPKLCHHLGNEFTFSMQGTPYSLREAAWPGAFPAMWSYRCFWWFELESLLETSQVPKPQRCPWNGCDVCRVSKEIQKGLEVSQVSEAAIFSLLAQFSNFNLFWAAHFASLSPASEIFTRLLLPLGETEQNEGRTHPQHFSQLRGREV